MHYSYISTCKLVTHDSKSNDAILLIGVLYVNEIAAWTDGGFIGASLSKLHTSAVYDRT